MRALESTDLLLNCTKFGYFSLWKIVKIVATRCKILRLKCTKFDLYASLAGSAQMAKHGRPQVICGFVFSQAVDKFAGTM
jgi:hypothetical protein